MSAKQKDLISGVFCLLFSIVMYIMSLSISYSSAEVLGPAFFPKVTSLLIGILSIGLIIKTITKSKNDKLNDNNVAYDKLNTEKVNFKINYNLLLNVLLISVYALLINKIGFIILSIFYLFFQILLISAKEDLTKRNLIIFSIISLLVPIILYYGFYNIFDVFLPEGLLG